MPGREAHPVYGYDITPYWVKLAVIARDKHICQICGTDIRANYLAWRRTRPVAGFGYTQEQWKAWWAGRETTREEHDHIVPFCEGGATVLENMRTLCNACHKTRTAEWRKARKEKKA
jgi:5-methylcytosine-specific restriction endonuclease McrA